MNIKSIVNNILPIDPKVRAESMQGVRAQGSTDRDANGQREKQEEPAKQHLTEEEFQQALSVLKENQGIKSNALALRVTTENNLRIVYIEDAGGQVIRRLVEADLWAVTRSQDRTTGTIYDKAM